MTKLLYTIDDLIDTNAAGLSIIRSSESLMLRWYLCPANVWTIGYGTTEGSLPNVTRKLMPGPIDERAAEKLLVRGLITTYEPGVERHGLYLTENQFSALVSFVYNIGAAAFAKSTLLKKLKAGDYLGAADELLRWTRGGGEFLLGLLLRRQAERALFLEEPEELRAELVARLVPMVPMKISRLPTRSPQVPKLLEDPYALEFAGLTF